MANYTIIGPDTISNINKALANTKVQPKSPCDGTIALLYDNKLAKVINFSVSIPTLIGDIDKIISITQGELAGFPLTLADVEDCDPTIIHSVGLELTNNKCILSASLNDGSERVFNYNSQNPRFEQTGTIAELNEFLNSKLRIGSGSRDPVDIGISVIKIFVDDAFRGELSVKVFAAPTIIKSNNISFSDTTTEVPLGYTLSTTDIDTSALRTVVVTVNTLSGSKLATLYEDGAIANNGSILNLGPATVSELNERLAKLTIRNSAHDANSNTRIQITVDSNTSYELIDTTQVYLTPKLTGAAGWSSINVSTDRLTLKAVVESGAAIDADAQHTVTVTPKSSTYKLYDDAGSPIAVNNVWTITGSVNEINDKLARSSIERASDAGGTGSIDLNLDNGTDTATIAVNVYALPKLTASTTSIIADATKIVLPVQLTTNNADPNVSHTVVVTPTSSAFIFTNDANGTISTNNVWTIVGTVNEINAKLAASGIKRASDSYGTGTVIVDFDDNTDTKTINVTVYALPKLSISNSSLTIDSTKRALGVSLTTSNIDTSASHTLVVSGNSSGYDIYDESSSATSRNWTITGTVSQINSKLSSGRIAQTDTSYHNATVSFNLDNGRDSKSMSVTMYAQPTINGHSSMSITQNASAVSLGVTLGTSNIDTSAKHTVKLTPSNVKLTVGSSTYTSAYTISSNTVANLNNTLNTVKISTTGTSNGSVVVSLDNGKAKKTISISVKAHTTTYGFNGPSTVKVGRLNTYVSLCQTLVCSDSDSSTAGIVFSGSKNIDYMFMPGMSMNGGGSFTNSTLGTIKQYTAQMQVQLNSGRNGTITLTEPERGYTKSIGITL